MVYIRMLRYRDKEIITARKSKDGGQSIYGCLYS